MNTPIVSAPSAYPNRAPKLSSIAARLESLSIPEPNSGCQLWLGSVSLGYGRICIKGNYRPAHRVAYALRHGPVPEGLHVCHKCDVPSCINVDHLFLGTRADNMRDKARKRRGTALLADETVLCIYRDSRSNCAIAREFGIGESTVRGIKGGWYYRWLTGAQDTRPPRARRMGS